MICCNPISKSFFFLGEAGIWLVLDPFICPRFSNVSVRRHVWVTMGQSRLVNLFFEAITISKFFWAITISKFIFLGQRGSWNSTFYDAITISKFIFLGQRGSWNSTFSDAITITKKNRSDSLRNPNIFIRSQWILEGIHTLSLEINEFLNESTHFH